MSKIMIVVVGLMSSIWIGAVSAEEKTCTVKGMHCNGCTEMVTGKICDENKYEKCEVKILDSKKEIGEIHLVTKAKDAKVDEAAIKAVIADAGYNMQSCKTSKEKPASAKAAKSKG
jgi:hypothetical protein